MVGLVGCGLGVAVATLLAYAPYPDKAPFGRALIFPVLFVSVGVMQWRRSLCVGPLNGVRYAVGMTLAGLILGSLGLIGDYWIGEARSVTLWRLGFLLDVVGGALALLGSTAVGLIMLRVFQSPRPIWCVGLAGVVPLSAALAFALNGYVPSFHVAALCVVWGVALSARRAGRTGRERT